MHHWSEKKELANLVVSKVRSDLGFEDEGSSRSYDEGCMEHEDEDHVSKSRKLEKRRLHKQIISKGDGPTSQQSWSPMKISKRGWSTRSSLLRGISMKIPAAP